MRGPAGRAWHEHPAARVLLPLVAVIAVVAIGFTAVHKQVRDGNDFPIYWQAARDLLSGRSPYDVGSGLHGYVYLPWFALLVAPLAPLSLPFAAACWYTANVAFLVIAVGALRETITAVLGPVRARVWLLAALPLAGLAHDNLVLGQANLLVLLLVAATAQGALAARRHPTHGMALGVAAALKMPAALLLVPLVLRGRGRALAGFALGALLALALPFLVTGVPLGTRLLQDWQAKVVAPAAAGQLQGSKTIDQSPHAALRRLLVAEPAARGRAVNVASLDRAGFARVGRAAAAVLLAAYLLVWLAAPAKHDPRALLLDLSLGSCAMVQVVGFNLKAQFVVLLLPAWTAAALAWRGPGRVPRVLLGAAGALFLLSQPGLVGRDTSEWLLAHSSMTLGTLLLAAVLVVQRLSLRPSPSVAPAGARATGTTA